MTADPATTAFWPYAAHAIGSVALIVVAALLAVAAWRYGEGFLARRRTRTRRSR